MLRIFFIISKMWRHAKRKDENDDIRVSEYKQENHRLKNKDGCRREEKKFKTNDKLHVIFVLWNTASARRQCWKCMKTWRQHEKMTIKEKLKVDGWWWLVGTFKMRIKLKSLIFMFEIKFSRDLLKVTFHLQCVRHVRHEAAKQYPLILNEMENILLSLILLHYL